MNGPSRRAVLFDLDGTLLDTLPDIAAAVNVALASMRAAVRHPDEIRGYVGGGMRDLAERCLPDGRKSPDDVDACLAALRRAYAGRCTQGTAPYPGIFDLIDQLESSGWELGVVSNKLEEFTQPIIAHYFPGRFRFVTGAVPELPRKPDPALALRAAEALDVLPECCVFVGDSSVDMRTAFSAGMKPVGVSWGFRSREEILTAGDVPILDSAVELGKFLSELR